MNNSFLKWFGICSVRLRDACAKFVRVPRFLGAFRVREQQKTSAAMNETGLHEMDRIRKRLGRKVPPQEEIKNPTLPLLRKRILADMLYRIKARFGAYINGKTLQCYVFINMRQNRKYPYIGEIKPMSKAAIPFGIAQRLVANAGNS